MSESSRGSWKATLWPQLAGPLLALGAAAVVEWLARGPFSLPNPPAILLLVVVLSAFIGGVTSGLVAALIAWLYFVHYFSIPGHPLAYTTENLRRVIVWAATTPLMAIMVGILKQRSERAFEISKQNAVLRAQMAERMRAEQAVRESAARASTILSNALDCIITMDHEGRVLEFNPAAEATFKYHRDQVVGRELVDLIVPPHLRDHHRRGLARYTATGESTILNKRIEITAVRATGEEFPVELTVVRDPTVDPPVFIGFARDITERKQAEEALRLSERRYRALIENSSDAITLTKPDRTTAYASPGTGRVTGYSPEEFVAQDPFALIHPGDRERILGIFAQVLGEPGGHTAAAFRMRHKDGSWRWIEAVGTNLLADPAVEAIVGNFRDVTDRKQAEERLQHLAAIVESSEDAILSKTLDGTILSWNRGAERVYGYSAEEIVGRPVSVLLPPDRPNELPDLMARLERGERIDQYETERVRKDGKRIDVSLTLSPVRDAAGEIIGASTIARDTTARKQAEKEIRALNEELEARVRNRTALLQAANEEMEAFVYSVAHDLRSPLITIAGFAQMLLEDHGPGLPDDGQRVVGQIVRSAGQMNTLIENLLSLSRLGRRPFKQEPVATADLVRQALAEIDGSDGDRRQAVRIGDLPPCQADAALLKQVLINLLSNALKFTRNREDARIEVGWRGDLDDPAFHAYFVKDNGEGFDMRYAPKLFGVFQRLHHAAEFEGNGVGLAIVRRIIHRHGGKVWAEAEVGKGATFFFTLPRRDAA